MGVKRSLYPSIYNDHELQIACNLERKFAELGFATQGSDAQKYRDETYTIWIGDGPKDGTVLVCLSDWLHEISNTGCLFRNALSAYPESTAIRRVVDEYKPNVRQMFRTRLAKIAPDRDIDALAEALLVLHEGLTETHD